MKTTKLTYVQPTSKVVELHVKNQLLAGSDYAPTSGITGMEEPEEI